MARPVIRESEFPFIVWVGGIDDRYETREQAESAVREWTAKGYTDVQLETIEQDC